MIEHITHKLTHITLLAAALSAGGASADHLEAPLYSFSGFGTLGVVHSSEDQADFTSSILKPDGAGYSRTWSKDVGSLIGGQLTANFSSHLSAVLQIIAEQNDDNSYQPHVEWANIRYQFSPNFSARAGRTVLPTFLLADIRKVAYTYPWVRPPLEVYRLVPVTSIDGVDVRYHLHAGEFTNNLQANYGSVKNPLPDGGTIKGEQAWSLSYTVEYQAATAHIAYQSAKLTLDVVNPLFEGFRQFGPQGIALANKYDLDNKTFHVLTVAAAYDPGQWFVMTEWGHTDTHSFYGRGTGWYASAGYRIGKFTPYLTYGQAKADNLSDPGLNLSSVPPSLAGTAAGLNATLNSLLSTKPVQNTLSIGTRWDFMHNASLKLQYDHTDIGTGSSGVLTNLQPGFQPGGKVNVFSASIDFVF